MAKNKDKPVEDLHALLGASSSKKWLTCTPSARLEEKIPDQGSDEAREGTKAHDLMKILCLNEFHGVPLPEGMDSVEARSKHGFTMAMELAVRVFIEKVKDVVDPLKEAGHPVTVLVELKFDYSEWVPEGFGTADLVVICGHTVWVFDFKFGQGVSVYAEENTQMMLYALGVYQNLSFAYEDINEIDLNIVQPRLGAASSWRILLKDLLDWADSIKPIADRAWKGEGDFVPGSHCAECFCKARFSCRARAQWVLAKCDEPLLTQSDKAAIYGTLADVASWANGLQAQYLKDAVAGEKLPGWKLVEGRSNRVIKDEKLAAARLVANGVPQEKIFTEPKMVGLGALEELVGSKKKFNELLEDILYKPPGKPTLVLESDPRATWSPSSTAEEDFAD